MTREAEVGLDLLLAWLDQVHERRFSVTEREEISPGAVGVLCRADSICLAVEVHTILGPTENEPWLSLRDELERSLAVDASDGIAVWLPAGADLPSAEADIAEFVRLTRQAAHALGLGERGSVRLPINLYLRKTGDEGGLMSVVGGLNRYWARLTERARGSFGLDSMRLHRLPDDAEELDKLLATIWEGAEGLGPPGESMEIETIDAWTVQRLRGTEGTAIIGVPPEETKEMGLAVRRNVRRILAGAGPRLRGREADVRALVLMGYYPHIEEEGVSTALRGYDPSLYAGLDFLCLAADGQVTPIAQAPAHVLPW
jgi:hypothetical protein